MMPNRKNIAIILTLLIFTLSLFAYWTGLAELWRRWGHQAEYGHGYFIPLLTVWFLWERKHRLMESIGQGARSGIFLICLASTLLILGEVTAFYLAIQLGFILFVMGLFLTLGGKQLLKPSFMPLLLLIFCIPLPYFLEALLTAKLQLISSQIGVYLLRFLGHSVYLEGNLIELGDYKLQVVEACSGLRYLYPLLGIGFIIAYIYQGAVWKKLCLFLSAIPITVMMNSVRIAMVGLLVDRWGIGMAEGFLHYFEGWIIFIICLLLMVAEIVLLEFFSTKRTLLVALNMPTEQATVSSQHPIKFTPLVGALLIMLLTVMTIIQINQRKEIHPTHKNLNEYPLLVNNWAGEQLSLPEGELAILGLEEYLLADYKNSDNDTINFYIAYYASQRKGISPHSPQVCMPGGGWVITSIKRVGVPDGRGGTFFANRVIIQKNDEKQLVYYWYQQRGRKIASEYEMKFYLLKDAITMNRTDGALVRLVSPIKDNERIADVYMQAFIAENISILPQYIPN